MTDLPTFVLERRFEAPRALVWRAWTDQTLLARWYGPGVETIVHQLDVRPGGVWLNEMKMGANSMYQRAEYTEVVEPELLVCLMSTTDANWQIATNPRMPDWPRILLTTVTFEQVGKQTKVRLTWVPHNATEAEIACFSAAIAGLDKGWGAGMEQLAKILAELQA